MAADTSHAATSRKRAWACLEGFACWSREIHSSGDSSHGEDKASSSVSRKASVLWTSPPGINTVELIRESLPLPSPRAFFDKFLADNAAYTILDGDFPPWNDHINTSHGELEPWNGTKRKMRFRAYPITPAIVSFKSWVLFIEQEHEYQFVTDPSDGTEYLQFTNFSIVRQTGGVPYAGTFTMRQLWTISPMPAKGPGLPASCELHINAELKFLGPPPLLAYVVRSRSHGDHRAGTKGWLRGARACLAQSSADSSSWSTKGLEAGSASTRQVKASDGMRKCRGPLALLMSLFILALWMTCSMMEVDDKVRMSYPSLILSLRGMLAL
jgi:hypothetical protein